MADETSSTSNAGQGQAQPPAKVADAPAEAKYTPSEWKSRARVFGVSPHAIAGALHDAEAEAHFTEQQVRNALKSFLEREIHPGE